MIITRFPYTKPTKQESQDYLAFVKGYEASLAEKQKRTKKKEKAIVHTPALRNSVRRAGAPGHLLVPNTLTSPCNICADAQYNQLCCYAKTCSALIYAATLSLGELTAFFPSLENLQREMEGPRDNR